MKFEEFKEGVLDKLAETGKDKLIHALLMDLEQSAISSFSKVWTKENIIEPKECEHEWQTLDKHEGLLNRCCIKCGYEEFKQQEKPMPVDNVWDDDGIENEDKPLSGLQPENYFMGRCPKCGHYDLFTKLGEAKPEPCQHDWCIENISSNKNDFIYFYKCSKCRESQVSISHKMKQPEELRSVELLNDISSMRILFLTVNQLITILKENGLCK